MEKSLTIKVYRAGDGWRGSVHEDGDEYAKVFVSDPRTALDGALSYVWPILEEQARGSSEHA